MGLFGTRSPPLSSKLDGEDASAMYIKGVIFKRNHNNGRFKRRWFALNFGDLILRYYDLGNYYTVCGALGAALLFGFFLVVTGIETPLFFLSLSVLP